MEERATYGKSKSSGVLIIPLGLGDVMYQIDALDHKLKLLFRGVEAVDKLIQSALDLKREMEEEQ